MRRNLKLGMFVVALMVGMLPSIGCVADEFRGFWVDGFSSHDPSFKTASQTTDLVNNAAAGHFNAICMNARQVGYCYFIPTAPNVEPRGAVSPSSYDPLADLVAKAHAQGIKVHAWVWANRIAETQYSNPNHVMNVHPEWLTKDTSGSTRPDGAFWLDPGVPDAMTWNYNACMDLVQHYDIDGLHFDYIRYPELDAGYNSIALARFNDEYGRTGMPSTTDSDFSAWRRRQITDFVKKVYASAVAIKPNIVISAAVFASTSGYSNKLQAWPTWMDKGYLDASVPMIYYGPTGNSSFLTYMRSTHDLSYGRHTYIGQGAGSNPISNTQTQIQYVRDEGCEGTMCYSYHGTNNEGATTETFFSSLGSSIFAAPANASAMSWKTSQGILKGVVTGQGGSPVYNATITVNGQTDLSDGTGFFALMKQSAGTYTVTCTASGYLAATAQVTITAGTVATKDFSLVPDGTPPTLSSIQVSDIWSTTAKISWNSNEAASGQVEYGTSTSYGNLTTVNTAKVTAHSFDLAGLSPSTVYHYRVRSIDGTGNEGVSTDKTFTTAGACVVQDIIVDNDNTNNSKGSQASSSGSWTVASTLSGRYSTNYAYIARVTPPDTAWFRWMPNIIVPGTYKVYVWYTADPSSTHNTGAPYTVSYNGGSQTFAVNQRSNCGQWNLLGSFDFQAGTSGYVQVGNGTDASGTYVMADAVKLVYECDTTPPTFNSVSVTPSLVPPGAALTVTASVTDNVGVSTVSVNGRPLGFVGGTTYSGTVPADTAVGIHAVSVIAADVNNNRSYNSSQRYRTGQIVGVSNRALLSGGPVQAGAGAFIFRAWGSVSVMNADVFVLSDGSPTPITVHCAAHGLTTGQFVTALGLWNYTQLESQTAQIKVFQ